MDSRFRGNDNGKDIATFSTYSLKTRMDITFQARHRETAIPVRLPAVAAINFLETPICAES